MADIRTTSINVKRMIDGGANREDILQYVTGQGFSVDAIKQFNQSERAKKTSGNLPPAASGVPSGKPDLKVVKIRAKYMADKGASADKIREYISKHGATTEEIRNLKLNESDYGIDSNSGAPSSIRMSMGNKDPWDQLATLRKHYPDAQPYGGSVMDEVKTSDNFIYTDPKTGRQKLANPVGLDRGDIAQNMRIGAEMAGGAVGGAIGGVSPDPATTAAGVALGSGLGAQAYDLLQENIGGQVNTRTPGQRLAQAYQDVMLNAIAPAGIGAAKGGFKRAVEFMHPAARNRMGASSSAEMLKMFEKENVPKIAGAVTGNKGLQQVEQVLSGGLVTGGKMRNLYNTAYDVIEENVENLAAGYGPNKINQVFGARMKLGAKTGIDNLRNVAKNAYEPITRQIGRQTVVPANNTIAALDDMLSKFDQTTESGKILGSKIQKIRDVIASDVAENGGLPYEVLSEWRTYIGDAAYGKGIKTLDDIGESRLKRLNSAMRQDKFEAAESFGLTSQLKAADEKYTSIKNQILPTLEKIQKWRDGDVYKKLVQSAMVDDTELKALQAVLPEKEFDMVRAQIIRNMGKATASQAGAQEGAFSFRTFLTNYNKIRGNNTDASMSIKRLFPGGQNGGELVPKLDRLVKIMGSFKDYDDVINFSRTGQYNQVRDTLYKPIFGPDAGAIRKAAGWTAVQGADLAMRSVGMLKLITNPKFVDWLAKGTYIADHSPKSFGSHLARLATLMETEGDIRDEVKEYTEKMWKATGEKMSAKEIGAVKYILDLYDKQKRREVGLLPGNQIGSQLPK